jgi:hypothetical protein
MSNAWGALKMRTGHRRILLGLGAPPKRSAEARGRDASRGCGLHVNLEHSRFKHSDGHSRVSFSTI